MTDDQKIKAIEIMSNQVVACQQEITSYNRAFISSAIICSVLTAMAALLSNNAYNDEYSAYIILLIPIFYLLSLFNLLKYTGFQIELGSYRLSLEKRINNLMGGETVLNWSKHKTYNNGFVGVEGFGLAVFYLPPLALLHMMVNPVLQENNYMKLFMLVYGVEGFICIWELGRLLQKKSKGEKVFEE